jgi:hypothetical protein
MDEQPTRYFTEIDPTLPPEELAAAIRFAVEIWTMEMWSMEMGEAALPVEIVDRLHAWADDPRPPVARAAIMALIAADACPLEELGIWLATFADEPEQDTIANILWKLSDLIEEEDASRWLAFLASVVARYHNYTAAILMEFHVNRYPDDYDLLWPHVEALLDMHNPDVTTPVMVCILEHVIVNRFWGPESPNIAGWITGADDLRKHVLLGIAAYQGLHEGRLSEIVQALSGDADPEIAATARKMLTAEKALVKERKTKKHKARRPSKRQ